MRLQDKTAIVTGGASGIGRATSILFAREGAKVVIGDIDDKGGNDTVAQINSGGGQAIFVHADVTAEPEAEKLVKTCIDNYKKVDILFNNVGTIHADTPIDQMELSMWDRIFAINVRSMFLCSKYTLREMKKNQRGVIINCGSMGAIRPRLYRSAYTASKGAVDAFTRGLALETVKFGIRSCSINPVVTVTPMAVRDLPPSVDRDEFWKNVAKSVPMGRPATPEDIANAVLFLASDEASIITGSAFNLSGGREL